MQQKWSDFDLFSTIIKILNLWPEEIRYLQRKVYRRFYLWAIRILQTLVKEGHLSFHAMKDLFTRHHQYAFERCFL